MIYSCKNQGVCEITLLSACEIHSVSEVFSKEGNLVLNFSDIIEFLVSGSKNQIVRAACKRNFL